MCTASSATRKKGKPLLGGKGNFSVLVLAVSWTSCDLGLYKRSICWENLCFGAAQNIWSLALVLQVGVTLCRQHHCQSSKDRMTNENKVEHRM